MSQVHPLPPLSRAARIYAELRLRLFVFLGLASALGCAQITLREAMGRVQEEYVHTVEVIEEGSNLDARDAARELREALQNPAIGKNSPQAADPEFQRLLRDAMEAVDAVQKRARSFDAAQLLASRSEISLRCQACHDRFRPKR
jgi:uncharacterized UPF0160 family protein